MGDRGNIVIRQGETNRDDVWFYGHWSGYRLEATVQEALAKRWRWTDPPYLARIVFDVFTQKHHGEEHSFGISTSIGDNQYPIWVVDVPKQTVWTIEEKQLVDGRIPDDFKPQSQRTFGEIASAPVKA